MKSKALLLFIFFICSQLVVGQVAHLREFTTSNGAPSNYFNDVDFDSEGRAIFATDDGLFSFNGSDFKGLALDKVVNRVAVNQKEIVFSCDDTLFKWNANSVETIALHATSIRDIAFKNGHTFILGQSDWAVYKGAKKLYSGELNDAKQFVVSNENVFLIHGYGVKKWNGQSWSKLFTTENLIVGAYPKSIGSWVVLEEEHWYEMPLKSSAIGEYHDLPNTRALHWNNYGVGAIAGAEEVVIFAKNRKQIIRQEGLNFKIEQCAVDASGGIWFLTQGNGCYYAETPEVVFTEGEDENGSEEWQISSGLNQQIKDKNYVDVLIDSTNQLLYGATEFSGVEVVDLLHDSEHFLDISKGLSHNYIKSWTLKKDTIFVLPKRGQINTVVRGKVVNNPSRFTEIESIAQRLTYDAGTDRIYFYNVNGNLFYLNEQNEQVNVSVIPSAREIFVDRGIVLLVANDKFELVNCEKENGRVFPLPSKLSDSRVVLGGSAKQDAFLIHFESGRITIPKSLLDRPKIDNLIINDLFINGKKIQGRDELLLPFGAYIIRIEFERINYSSLDLAPMFGAIRRGDKTSRRLALNGTVEFAISENGSYAISALTNNGAASKEIKISVEKPFWQSVWFWLVIIASMILLSFGSVFFRTRKIKREQKRLQLLVDQKTTLLRERNKDVEQIAYALSHDFKSPLATIFMLSEISQDATLSNDERDQSLSLLKSKCEDLSINMNGLIELVKIGTSDVAFEEINAVELIDSVVSSLSGEIEKIGVEVTCNGQLFLNGVPSYMYSICHNLIANAIKYADSGKKAFVNIELKQEAEMNIISISDNGIGMDLSGEKRERLFRPFKQVDSNADGVGLGLSLVKRMVEIHDGNIQIESVKGEGTEFILSFPTKSEK